MVRIGNTVFKNKFAKVVNIYSCCCKCGAGMAISDKTLILEKIKLSFVVSISKKKFLLKLRK